jgi:aspartate racemase
MFNTFKIAASAISIADKQAVGGIPCNTFHAPQIFKKFKLLMKEFEHKIKILNMIEETVLEVLRYYPGIQKIGLMSTTGTRNAGIYSDQFQKKDLEVIQVPIEIQQNLHNSIYNKEWGIKAKTPVSDRAKENFKKYANDLISKGAEIIILGCTEIPLALPNSTHNGIPFIDPMTSLARALIREANSTKLKQKI